MTKGFMRGPSFSAHLFCLRMGYVPEGSRRLIHLGTGMPRCVQIRCPGSGSKWHSWFKGVLKESTLCSGLWGSLEGQSDTVLALKGFVILTGM